MSDRLQFNIKIVLLMVKLESPTLVRLLSSIYRLDSYEKKNNI
jgi:hypothetical protein